MLQFLLWDLSVSYLSGSRIIHIILSGTFYIHRPLWATFHPHSQYWFVVDVHSLGFAIGKQICLPTMFKPILTYFYYTVLSVEWCADFSDTCSNKLSLSFTASCDQHSRMSYDFWYVSIRYHDAYEITFNLDIVAWIHRIRVCSCSGYTAHSHPDHIFETYKDGISKVYSQELTVVSA